MSRRKKQDMTMLLVILFLISFGLITLYSTSAYNGQVKFHDAAYYFKKQLFATILGAVLMCGISRMDYHIFEKFGIVF